jgi:hypothetical protein
MHINRHLFYTSAFTTLYDNLGTDARQHFDSIQEEEDKRDALNTAEWERKRADRESEDGLSRQIGALERAKSRDAATWTEASERNLVRLTQQRNKLRAKRSVTPEPVKKIDPKERTIIGIRNELVPPVEDWLNSIPATARFEFAPVDANGYTLESASAEEREILSESIRVDTLPILYSEAENEIERALDEAAAQATPDLRRVASGGRLELPRDVTFSRDASQSLVLEKGTSFLCWIDRATVRKKLIAVLKDQYKNGIEGISKAERAKRKTEIKDRLLAIHRIIARLLWEATDLGENVKWPPRLHALAAFELVRIEDAPIVTTEPADQTLAGDARTLPHKLSADQQKATVVVGKDRPVLVHKSVAGD